MFDYVVSQQYLKLFLSLREQGLSVSDEASHIGMTYSHLSKVCRKLEEQGFLDSEMQGRRKILSLTPAGQCVADGMALIQHGIKLSEYNMQNNAS